MPFDLITPYSDISKGARAALGLPPAPRFLDIGNITVGPEHALFRIDTSKAAPVTVDLVGGIAQAMPFDAGSMTTVGSVTIIGTPRAGAAGRQVVVNASSSDFGFLVIEESADGVFWGYPVEFPVTACQTIGVRFTTTKDQYRCSFRSEPGKSIKRVHVSSQLRTAGA